MTGLLFACLARLPLACLHRLGAIIGRLLYRIDRSYRQRFDGCFEQAGYGGDVGLRRRALEHAGRTLAELPWLWMRPSSQTVPRVEVVNWELVEAAREAGRGVLFLTPHLGCFEITAQRYAAEAPVTVLYSAPRQRWLARIVEGARDRRGLVAAPATLAGVRQLVRALRRGEAVGILPDQVPSAGDGAWAPLFGRLAYTMTLPARLARMTGATVLLTYGERLAGARFRMHVERWDGEFAEMPEEQAAQLNAAMESLIRRLPDQYLWAYNRYKRPAGAPMPW